MSSAVLVTLGLLLYVVVVAVVLLAVYWVVRLAVRHEGRRATPAGAGSDAAVRPTGPTAPSA